jgi:nucleoside-diphosphate-sugar epimerase
MIYVSGCGGMIGRRFNDLCKRNITSVSYREEVRDVFKSHKKSCLIHLAWSSTTRDTDGLKAKNDIFNSQKLFDYYLNKNPNGKIIFVSTAGDMHADHGGGFCVGPQDPTPRTLYGKSKLHVERILETLNCKTVVLRTSNIWGGKVSKKRVNGLPDKLMNALNTDQVVEIYANLDTYVDLIHIDDFINLLIKVIDVDLDEDHEVFLVGGQCISISDIIKKVSEKGVLNLKIDQKAERTYIDVRPIRAEQVFNWKRENHL